MKIKAILTSLLLLFLAGLGGFYYWIGTPLYSLYLLRQAIRSGDREAFYRHFALTAVLENNVERSLDLLPAPIRPFSERATTVLIPLAVPLLEARIDQQLGHPERSPLLKMKLDSVRYEGINAHVTLRHPKDDSTTVLVLSPIANRQWQIVDIDLSQANLGFSWEELQPQGRVESGL